jgi:hypothetical protein
MRSAMQLGATYTYTPHGTAAALFTISVLAVFIVDLAALWQLFRKAGRPRWAAIIPFYNFYVLIRVAGRSGWWFIALLIPYVNLVATVIICRGVARAFGKGIAFTCGLVVLGFIFLPVLGFGGARYLGEPTSERPPASQEYFFR